MAQLTAAFEAGTNGNGITTGAGEASATAWDIVTAGSGSITYDNAHAAHGSLAAKVTTVAAAHDYLAWTTALGTVTDHYGRLCLYLTANPAAGLYVMSAWDATVFACNIGITTGGKLYVEDSLGSGLSSTASVALNQWIRIEYHMVHSATVGQYEAKLFNTADSSTADETLTSAANKNTRANAVAVRFGVGVGVSPIGSQTVWLDDIVANATSYPGPVVVAGAPAKWAWRSRAFPSTLGPPRVI